MKRNTALYTMIISGSTLFYFALPVAAAPSDFRGLVNLLIGLFNQAIAVSVGLAVVFILYNIVKMLLHADNEKIRSDARTLMLYGILSLFVIVSMWGLINLLIATFFGGSVPGISV